MLSSVRGNRGELAAFLLTDKPERLQALQTVYLFGDGAPFEVERVWNHNGRWIFKFHGIDSISQAERLRGAEVRIPFSERYPLDAGEYYMSDLVGCEVIQRPSGESLGPVAAWQNFGGPPLLQVGERLLIPFNKSICVSIDLEKRRIEVDLPDGLKDLN